MYEIYCKLRDERKLKDSDVSKATEISKSTFSDWKSGRSVPKGEKMQRLANFFGVSVEYLMTGEKRENAYYIDEAAREYAQFLFDNPEYKVLFDASRKVKREDIGFVETMLKRMGGDSSDA